MRDGRHTVLAQAHGGCEGRHGSSVTEQTVGSVQRPQEVRRVDNPCTQCDPKTLDSLVQYIPSCYRKGKSCETICASRHQRLVCRRSPSHTSSMHSGSRRTSTDAPHTALQRAVWPYAGCTTLGTDAGLAGTPVPCPLCLGGVTRGAGVTPPRRGARAQARVTQAVYRWSGVVGWDSAILRTDDAAVAGPRSPVLLARRPHPLVLPVRRSRVLWRLSCVRARVRDPPAGVNPILDRKSTRLNSSH